jgi:hypothetical protein
MRAVRVFHSTYIITTDNNLVGGDFVKRLSAIYHAEMDGLSQVEKNEMMGDLCNVLQEEMASRDKGKLTTASLMDKTVQEFRQAVCNIATLFRYHL